MVTCSTQTTWYKCVLAVFSGTPVARLTSQAYLRIQAALRPRTASSYMSKFKLYLAFIGWYNLPLHVVDTILAFLEFLVQHGSKAHTLTSYVSVLSHYFKLFDIDPSSLTHRKVYLFTKSVSINSPYCPKFRGTISIPLLHQLVSACDSIPYGKIYKSAFLLAFFAFLRLSNLAPVSPKSFDPTRHFLRGDVIFGHPGAHIILKWAKSMQSSSKHQVIQIPLLPQSPLCPVTALKHLLHSVPAPSSAPLFLLPRPSGLSVLTAPMISACLSKIITGLGLNPSHFGFHSFRRSGVSWAADHNVPIQNLKAHGGWSSSAINCYLTHTPIASSTVATTFQRLLNH